LGSVGNSLIESFGKVCNYVQLKSFFQAYAQPEAIEIRVTNTFYFAHHFVTIVYSCMSSPLYLRLFVC